MTQVCSTVRPVLNISKEQVAALPVNRIISGHEHQYKLANKIILLGNQIATSVSDWVSNGTNKVYLQLSNHQDQPTTIQEVPQHLRTRNTLRLIGVTCLQILTRCLFVLSEMQKPPKPPRLFLAIAAFRQVSRPT